MKVDLSAYKTKSERIRYLVANKKQLIEFKCAGGYKRADAFGGTAFEANALKALNTSYQDDPASGVIKRTVILNTYNWMDSHDDVHLAGIFTESITTTEDKFHLHDHEYKLVSRVGEPQKFYEREVKWTDLGVNLTGNTIGLFMDSNIHKDMNAQIFQDYLRNKITQHSVGMLYLELHLAIDDSQYKEEYEAWTKYVSLIGNRSLAEDKGYFWAVTKADLIEGSAVLRGSNELTPGIPNQPKSVETNSKTKNYYLSLAK